MELFIHSFHHYDLYSTASPSSRITCTISSTYFEHNSSPCASTITRITGSVPLSRRRILPFSPKAALIRSFSACTRALPVTAALSLNLYILQKLRVHLHPLAQRAETLLLLQDHLHQHQCRKDSISGRRMLTENDMSGLLSAEHISVGNHRLIDILIADRGHTYLNALALHRFEQSHVGHDRGNHRIILQTATFLQILPTYIQDIIPVHFHTVLIHGNTPIRISVKRKSAIQILLPDKSLQIPDMCRSTSHIDVGTIRLIANHICFGAKRIKHTLCNIKRTSVGAIQPHAHTIVKSGSQRNQIADVMVPSDRIIPEILCQFSCNI